MWWLITLLIIAAFILYILIRTALFRPLNKEKDFSKAPDFDKDKAIYRLSELIKCKTVSYRNPSLEDESEFKKFKDLLQKLYPNVFKICEYKELPDRALLFKWSGKSDINPVILMSHYDVVPANEELWDKPPFCGEIENGVLWGRGALDTKVTFNAVLSAAEHHIENGFTPENDIYFAFSGGEEINGNGARNIVDYFLENNIEPLLVLDEGGAVVENVFPGVTAPCGLIGIAEKGMMDVEFKVRSNGGHASAPKPNSPVVRLSKACKKIEDNPTKAHISAPVAKMFDTLGRHSNLLFRIIFANLWLFSPVLDIICKKSGGELNALMRTTVAFTQMEGSSAPNVIPPEARMVSNIRINPADTMDSVLEYLRRTVKDENVEITALHGINPSRISTTDCIGYRKIADAIAATWSGTIVSPYLMVQCSDSRHYGRISDRVYRFSAMDLTTEERATIHGNNERIRLDCICRAVEFYIRLIGTC